MGIIIPDKLEYDIDKEKSIDEIKFNIFKFSDRQRPANREEIIIISCFSEFGCEPIIPMYCIPQINKKYPQNYKIAVGWYGRDYLYKHLVDEYWEIDESFQWLREHSRAFGNESKNITRIEKEILKFGMVYPASYMGDMVLAYRCKKCNYIGADWETNSDYCYHCGNEDLVPSVLSNTNYWKKYIKKIPSPSKEKSELIKKYLKPNSVGIVARGRKCYGRNLQPEFYIKLINLFKKMGYNPVWLGEKQSIIPCPVDDILDFSSMPEARDLEMTLALIQQLEFTIQFWTASTRLSAMVDTPFIIVESPDQIVGMGQEGKRLNLTSFCDRKIVFCHYMSILEDNDTAINLLGDVVEQVKNKDFSTVIGLVEDRAVIQSMIQSWNDREGEKNGYL